MATEPSSSCRLRVCTLPAFGFSSPCADQIAGLGVQEQELAESSDDELAVRRGGAAEQGQLFPCAVCRLRSRRWEHVGEGTGLEVLYHFRTVLPAPQIHTPPNMNCL